MCHILEIAIRNNIPTLMDCFNMRHPLMMISKESAGIFAACKFSIKFSFSYISTLITPNSLEQGSQTVACVPPVVRQPMFSGTGT
jgi:hypothetical protein